MFISEQHDLENRALVETGAEIDAIDSQFYSRFQYPGPPIKFDYLLDPLHETRMLNQSLGDWQQRTIPEHAQIWVAGCGTNQAIFTALKFPHAAVLGTDISASSLEAARQAAQQLGITNLELREQTINHVGYHQQFDYILCTGVIHHMVDPGMALAKLAAALKPGGILELMVYNQYHRIMTSAFQRAVRLFGQSVTPDFEADLMVARELIAARPQVGPLADYLHQFEGAPEVILADSLLQPVEHSYTVAGLSALAQRCGLELRLPATNLYDKDADHTSWNMTFDNDALQARYDQLPDLQRWQITNLLLLDASPMIWFYLQHATSSHTAVGEREICETFLHTTFAKTTTTQRNYFRGTDGTYTLSPRSIPYPVPPRDPLSQALLAAVDGKTPMREMFSRLGIAPTFQIVNQARIKLTTTQFPYLQAVQSAPLPDDPARVELEAVSYDIAAIDQLSDDEVDAFLTDLLAQEKDHT